MSSKSTDKETKTAAGAAEDVEVKETAEAKTDEPAMLKAEPEAAKADAEETKPVEKKAEEKKTEEKKADKEETKAAKKTGTRKTAAKKTDKPELKPEVYIEYQGQQIVETAVVDKVKAKFAASGHRVSSIKSLKIYMKPEEAKAYYVINEGKYKDDVDLF